MPAGICAMESRASSPPSAPADIGTPITGRTLHAATTPGRWAAPPAAATNTLMPRPSASIAAAGGAAHLPGVVAAWSVLPVIGVPMSAGALGGLDALLSMAQMPAGIPVATVAIGDAVARNAGHLAMGILALGDP